MATATGTSAQLELSPEQEMLLKKFQGCKSPTEFMQISCRLLLHLTSGEPSEDSRRFAQDSLSDLRVVARYWADKHRKFFPPHNPKTVFLAMFDNTEQKLLTCSLRKIQPVFRECLTGNSALREARKLLTQSLRSFHKLKLA